MRILAIHTVYRRLGGAEFYILRLAEALEELGHEVLVAYPEDDAEPYRHPGRTELTLPRARGRGTSRRALEELNSIIDRHQPDLVHFNSTVGFLTGTVIRGCAQRLPVAKHVHDARVFCPKLRSKILPERPGAGADEPPRHCRLAAGWQCLRQGCLQEDRRGPVDVGPLSEHAREVLIRLGELRALRSIDGLFCSSDYIREELIRNHIPAEKIHVVGFFLPWAREATTPTDAAAEPPVIGAVGRWDRVKGLELLLEILLEIAPLADFRARILGRGPGLEEARRRVAAAGMEARIELPGHLDDEELRAFYASLAVLAFPSLIPESFGAAGIEAQAHGVPVVGFAAGGVSDWLQEGRNGLIGPVGDRVFMRDALLRLLRNPGERARLGVQARVDAWQRYERRSRTEHYAGKLQELIERRA